MAASPELRGPRSGLRTLLAFDKDPIGCLARWHAEFGDCFGVRVGGNSIVSIKGAEDVARVLLDKQRVYIKDQFTRELSRLVGQGLLTSEGDHWRGRRRLVAPTLRRNHIQHYADVFVRHTRGWVAEVSGEVDLHHEMMGLTLRIVAEALFAADEVQGVDRVGEAVERAMEAHIKIERSWQRILPGFVPGSPKWAMDRAAAVVSAEVDRLIEGRRSKPQGDDLLWRLIEARDEDGAGIDAAGLRDEAVTLFLAGHETTALALTFAVFLLGTHPEAAARLQAELAPFEGRSLTADDMPALPWTTAVVKETLRLYPPAWLLGRASVGEVQIGPHTLPAGTTVIIPVITMHADPLRFAAPEAFRPERWLGGFKPGRWDYLPFGGGARVCVGNHFAMMEAALILATMYQGAGFEVLRPTRPRLLPSVTLRPRDGLPVRIAAAR